MTDAVNLTKCVDGCCNRAKLYAANCIKVNTIVNKLSKKFKKSVFWKQQDCYQDCKEEFYTFELVEVDNDGGNEETGNQLNQSFSSISLFARVTEELSYVHRPQMVFVEFFSYLGGLFSVWIGGSVLMGYDIIVHVVRFIRRKYHQHTKKMPRAPQFSWSQ